MRYLLITIFLIVSVAIFSQDRVIFDSVKMIRLKYELSILPGGTDSWESYEIKKSRFRHKVALGRQIGRLEYKRRKLFKKGNKTQTLKGLDYFLNNQDKDYYDLNLSTIDTKNLLDKVKQFDNLNLTDSLIEKYINKKSLRITFSLFSSDYGRDVYDFTPVLDGVPFDIQFELIKHDNNLLKFGYSGNLAEDVFYQDFPDFFLFYHLRKEFNIFSNLRIADFFLKLQMEDIILNYIAIKEKTVEIKNTMIWEE